MSTYVNVTTWNELASIISNAEENQPTEITLTETSIPKAIKDMPISLKENTSIVLHSNSELGTTIIRTSSSRGEFIVTKNSSLTLKGKIIISGGNSSTEKNNTLTGANFIKVNEGGTLIIDANIFAKTTTLTTTGLFSFIHNKGNITLKDNSSISGWTISVKNTYVSKVLSYGGAALLIDGINAKMLMEKSSISNCVNTYANATRSAAVQIINGGTVTINGGNIINCGYNTKSSSQGPLGAAVYVGDDSELITTNSLFQNNKACKGGAIFVSSLGTVIINDSTVFTENSAGSGGALYVNGTVIARKANFSSNYNTHQYGSAIYIYGKQSLLDLDNCTIEKT